MKYEQTTQRLKEILTRLESDTVTLAESLELYEEGLKLAKSGLAEMKEFKGRIAKLSKEYSQLAESEFEGSGE